MYHGTYVIILTDFSLIKCILPIKITILRKIMKEKNVKTTQEPKEFTASDVKKIHESVDDKNGFHIDFIIHKLRARMKENQKPPK